MQNKQILAIYGKFTEDQIEVESLSEQLGVKRTFNYFVEHVNYFVFELLMTSPLKEYFSSQILAEFEMSHSIELKN